MKRFFVTLLMLGYLSIVLTQSEQKPKLRVLGMYPFTGLNLNQYTTCRAMVALVFDLVNNRSDILEDYVLEAHLMDDNNGVQIARRFLDFDAEFVNNKIGENIYKAPVVFGSPSGCEILASFAHLYGYTQVSPCAGEFLNNRRRYPNLYMIRPAGGQSWIARLKFITDVGRWKYFALLIGINQDLSSSMAMYNGALWEGVSVYIDIISDFDYDSMMALKRSSARIFVLSVPNQMIYQFLCQSYKYGLTGPRYITILPGSSFAVPQTLPAEPFPNCTKAIVTIQYKYTIMVTSQVIVDDPMQKSELGFTLAEMDRRLDDFTNKLRHPDYSLRYLCHDAALQSLLILDKADKALKAQNLSLLNIVDQPIMVGKVVNDSAVALEYTGLRQNGSSRYNEHGELTFSKWPISQWTNESGVKNIHIVTQKSNGSRYDPNAYYVTISGRGVQWLTPDREAPRDRALVMWQIAEVANSVKITIYFFATTLLLAKLAAIWWIVFKPKDATFRSMPLATLSCLASLILVDIGAILEVIELEFSQMSALHLAQGVTLLLGLTSANFSMVLRIFRLFISVGRVTLGKSPCKINQPSTALSRMGSNRLANNGLMDRSNETFYANAFNDLVFASLDKSTTKYFLYALFGCGCYILTWALVDPIACQAIELIDSPVYVETADTLIHTSVTHCSSKHEIPWMIASYGVNIVLLVAGCYCARNLTRNAQFIRLHPAVRHILHAMMNVVVMTSATILILLALSDHIGQRVVLASAALLISLFTACFNVVILFEGLKTNIAFSVNES